MKNDRYYSMSIEEVKQKLQTNEEGLSNKEAKKRLEKYGLNELPKKKPDSIFKIIFKEITDPIILLLIVAIIASLLVGEVVDAVAIFLIILVDLIIGTVEEKKANNTAEALSNLVREKVKVIREGKEYVSISVFSSSSSIKLFLLINDTNLIENIIFLSRIVFKNTFAFSWAILVFSFAIGLFLR